MRSTFNILFYINRSKVKTDGTTAILCRISIDGKNVVMTTGENCTQQTWNVKKNETADEKTNNRLSQFKKRIEDAYHAILKEQNAVSAELLKNRLSAVGVAPKYLLQAGETERERLKIKSERIKSTSSYRQSKTTQKNLRDFLAFKGMDDILFTEITEEFGEAFKLYLKKEQNYKPNHINHCLCWLNRLIYIAVDEEVLRANPIEEVTYEKKTPPQLLHINKEELARIMRTPMIDARQELTRRIFIFSCLTGLAFVDVKLLHPKHIGKTSEDKLYIRQQRKKTEVEAFIPLHPIAEQIIRLYNTTDDEKPVFPLPSRDVIWHEIQEIAFANGIRQNLSYHQARHSFGTLMLTAGVPIESISKMMGHANISSTQIYAKVTDKKISEDMDKLMKRREEENSR